MRQQGPGWKGDLVYDPIALRTRLQDGTYHFAVTVYPLIHASDKGVIVLKLMPMGN